MNLSAETILMSVGKFGLLPALVVYLVYMITSFIHEVKQDNKATQEKLEALSNKVACAIDAQTDQISELTKVVSTLQTAITTQVNTIMVYLFSDGKGKGGR